MVSCVLQVVIGYILYFVCTCHVNSWSVRENMRTAFRRYASDCIRFLGVAVNYCHLFNKHSSTNNTYERFNTRSLLALFTVMKAHVVSAHQEITVSPDLAESQRAESIIIHTDSAAVHTPSSAHDAALHTPSSMSHNERRVSYGAIYWLPRGVGR